MKKHRLLAVLLILGCMINVTGCNKNTVRVASSTNIQKKAVEAKELNESKNNNDEYDISVQEEITDIISEDDTLEKIVAPGYEEVEKYLDEEYLQNKAANIPDDIIKKGIFVKNIDEKIKLYDKTWASIK